MATQVFTDADLEALRRPMPGHQPTRKDTAMITETEATKQRLFVPARFLPLIANTPGPDTSPGTRNDWFLDTVKQLVAALKTPRLLSESEHRDAFRLVMWMKDHQSHLLGTDHR